MTQYTSRAQLKEKARDQMAGMDSSPVQHNTREQMPQTIEAIDKPLYFGSICGIF